MAGQYKFSDGSNYDAEVYGSTITSCRVHLKRRAIAFFTRQAIDIDKLLNTEGFALWCGELPSEETDSLINDLRPWTRGDIKKFRALFETFKVQKRRAGARRG